MATIDLMDQFSHLGEGGIRNNGTLDAEVMFQHSLRTMRTDFIQVKAGDSIVYKNMSGMSSIWNILSFYTGDAQGYYVSGIAGQTTPQSGVWTAAQDGYVRLFGSFPAGDKISVTMTDLAPDVEDYLSQYNAMNYRFLPNSIPKIVAHIQEYLVDHPIADSTTLQAVIDAAFQSYMDEIQQTADTYIAEAVPQAAAAAVDAAASPALQEITAKAAEAAESARQAGLSQQSAEMSEENALTYRNQAQQIKDSISAEVAASVLAAQEQATLAQESAQAADESADSAEQYVAQARAQAAAAAAQAQTASGYASDAQGYMQDASGFAQNASDFADAAAQSAATFSTDPTLTISGKAADAKATGDQLSALKSQTTEKLTLKQPTNLCHSDSDWTSDAYVDNGSGAITSNSGLSYSAKMPVNEGDVIRLYDYYGGSFGVRQIRSVAAYDSTDSFVRTPDSLGWKVNSYTVPSGVAYIILSAPTASQYMVVANTTVSAYEAWFEPYYVATYDFVKDAIEQGPITTQNIKNGFACALPKTKFRQTVGIPCTWYKSSMATPPSIYAYVNAGYSRTTNGKKTFSYNTLQANSTNNGYVWYEYDPFMNLLYKFDNNTGYGAPTVVKALNLSDCSLLAIGDSTVDHDTMTAKLLSYFTENGHTITLLGTLGSQSDPLNKNEGRAGWTTANYLANTTKNGYTNPFWNPTTEKFDFSYYMSQQGYSGVDFVVIQLGINDLYPTVPRGISTPNYSAIWANIRTMIDSIHEYNAATKIIINLPTTPNSNPEAHSTSEAIYQNFVINYNEYALNAMLSISENYVRASYCHLILDPATEIRDNVHPTVDGYEKMALEVVNQINCWQNGV